MRELKGTQQRTSHRAGECNGARSDRSDGRMEIMRRTRSTKRKGSARAPRAGFGAPPNPSGKWLRNGRGSLSRSSRRGASLGTRGACAPQSAALAPCTEHHVTGKSHPPSTTTAACAARTRAKVERISATSPGSPRSSPLRGNCEGREGVIRFIRSNDANWSGGVKGGTDLQSVRPAAVPDAVGPAQAPGTVAGRTDCKSVLRPRCRLRFLAS